MQHGAKESSTIRAHFWILHQLRSLQPLPHKLECYAISWGRYRHLQPRKAVSAETVRHSWHSRRYSICPCLRLYARSWKADGEHVGKAAGSVVCQGSLLQRETQKASSVQQKHCTIVNSIDEPNPNMQWRPLAIELGQTLPIRTHFNRLNSF